MLYPEGGASRTGSGFDVEEKVRRQVKNEAQSFGLSKAGGGWGGVLFTQGLRHTGSDSPEHQDCVSG